MTFDNETQFQKACSEYLDIKDIDYFHDEKGRGKGRRHRGGIPDLIIYPGNGKIFFIELKMPNKKLKPEQQLFKERCFKKNNHFYMCDNWEWFVDIIEKECK